MQLPYNSKFAVAIFISLFVFLSKLIVGNHLENDTETGGFNLTIKLDSNITEINITDITMVPFDNYSLVNTSHPLSNGTLVENYTILQDYNETYSSNFSNEENVTYTPQIDEARVPDAAMPSLPCTCDLIGDNCDVNCCCDKDCTERDKDAFYRCILPPVNIDERHCVSKTIIYDEMKIKEKVVERDDLFCIVHDHLKQRHEYLEPPVLRTMNEYNRFVPKTLYSWISASDSINTGTKYSKSMKAGESLYVRTMDGILTEWTLPTDIFSGYCGAHKALRYMVDDETTCQQITTDVKKACLHNKWLNALTYYKSFCVISSPEIIPFEKESNKTYPESEGDTYQCHSKFSITPSHNYTCRDKHGKPHMCTFNDDSDILPEYDAKENICKNIVTQVYYSVIHNGSIGITEVNVVFETSTLTSSQGSVSQYFFVRYYGTRNVQVFRRSGNPGYLLSYPVLAGNVAQNVILLSSDSNNWLTVMGRYMNGYCSKRNIDRLPVKFGENVNTGCLYKVNNASCIHIQKQVMDILNGFNSPSYVGMFGNSDIHNVGEWIKIQEEDKPTKSYSESSPDGDCSSIVLGVDIKIAYANTGSLDNPQRKIIGVLYKYLMSEDIRSPCMGPSCYAQVAHTVQLKTSVTFIDASKPAFPIYAQIPITKISFPHDFFYPLISGYSGSNISITLMDWSFYVAFAWLTSMFRTNIEILLF